MAAPASTFLALLLLSMFLPDGQTAKKTPSLVIKLEDHKEYKKLLRTRTNLLLIFAKSEKTFSSSSQLFRDVAEEMKGKATLAYMDCTESKKLCKKFKVSPSPLELKHYKDGEFNKDYDRKLAVKSMVNFLLDPTGDVPWQEDSTAQDIVHIDTTNGLSKLLRKEKNPLLVMFYAPWCGYCKKLKPDFASAATEMKGKATLVGIDVDKPEQQHLRVEYNITGFPTIVYFENGKKKYNYGGENNKDGIVNWLNDPQPKQEAKKEEEWADEVTDIVHLHDNDFEDYVQNNPSVLVMFYAPWCGHCKNMKPEYQEAAAQLKEEEIPGTIAAVDATKEKKLAEQAGVKGFPTVKYYRNGEMAFDVNERTADKIVEFMKDPKEPPPPPPPEPNWDETESDVHHLTDDTFKSFLKKKKHGLVMFYAPWCGHCKKAKPEFMNAASHFKEDSKVVFAALDCTAHVAVCGTHDVTGYPTFLYFNYGKNSQKYMGGREEPDFINFMRDPLATETSTPAPPVVPPSEDWQDIPGFQSIEYLTETTFDAVISQYNSILVMFYAPWCGHCKNMKPDFVTAANEVRDNEYGVLAAVDATKQSALAQRFEVKGYPTLKHFKDGKFSSDYKLGRTTADLVKFMKDPEAPPPTPPPAESEWNTETKEVHFLSKDNFDDFVKKNEKVLVMFYAPWCGHCKKMKPDYAEAAAIINKDVPNAKLAAVDVTKDKQLGDQFEVKGFPTLKFFQDGKFSSDYKLGRTTADFVKFMQDPEAPPPTPPPAESEWNTETKEVHFLSKDNFDDFVKNNEKVLVMFYAPWCGHCKKMKPDYAEAAAIVNKDVPNAKLAAVDVTKDKQLGDQFEVKGFPTLKFFQNGELKTDSPRSRLSKDLVQFMKGSESSTPPPAADEPEWEKTEAKEVSFLTSLSFDDFLKQNDFVLVMFFAPWCGHCKKMKPDYAAAASIVNKIMPTSKLATVDVTEEKELGKKYEIKGFPTLKFFEKGVMKMEYKGKRTKADFIAFMKEQTGYEPQFAHWSLEDGPVTFLNEETFKTTIEGSDVSMVMFYASFSGHCKHAKPKYEAAAIAMKDVENTLFAAVSCYEHTDFCTKENIAGHPTFRLYRKGKFVARYDGGRTEEDFIEYMKNPPKLKDEL